MKKSNVTGKLIIEKLGEVVIWGKFGWMVGWMSRHFYMWVGLDGVLIIVY